MIGSNNRLGWLRVLAIPDRSLMLKLLYYYQHWEILFNGWMKRVKRSLRSPAIFLFHYGNIFRGKSEMFWNSRKRTRRTCLSLSVGRCHSFIIPWDRFVPFSDWPQKLLIFPHSGKTKWRLLHIIRIKRSGYCCPKSPF